MSDFNRKNVGFFSRSFVQGKLEILDSQVHRLRCLHLTSQSQNLDSQGLEHSCLARVKDSTLGGPFLPLELSPGPYPQQLFFPLVVGNESFYCYMFLKRTFGFHTSP